MKYLVLCFLSVVWFQVDFLDVVNVPHTKIIGAIDRQDAIDRFDPTSIKEAPVEFRLRISHSEWYVSHDDNRTVWSNRMRDAKVMRSFEEMTKGLAAIYRTSKDRPFIVIEKSHPEIK